MLASIADKLALFSVRIQLASLNTKPLLQSGQVKSPRAVPCLCCGRYVWHMLCVGPPGVDVQLISADRGPR